MPNDNDQIQELLEEVASNPELRQRVRKASVDELLEIAEGKGLKISRGQLKKAIEDQGEELRAMAEKSASGDAQGLRILADWSG